ncbi:unnamed protein product [Urochloa humidicola]
MPIFVVLTERQSTECRDRAVPVTTTCFVVCLLMAEEVYAVILAKLDEMIAKFSSRAPSMSISPPPTPVINLTSKQA